MVKTYVDCIWAFRVLFFFITFVYFAELSTAKTRINLQILSQKMLFLGLDFQARTHPSCSSPYSLESKDKLRVKS